MEKDDERSTMIDLDFEPEAIILGGGDFPSHPIPLGILRKSSRVVCCDGAVNQCANRHILPWRVVGDGDSMSVEARHEFAEKIRIFPDQETNDQTKAVRYLKNKGIRKIAILGATGRREDHTLGNISLLIDYHRGGLDVRMYTDYGMFVACEDTTTFRCPVGTAVSIFGFGTNGMESEGLAYPLYDFTSWWQGTLNHTTKEVFTVRCHGSFLVYLSYENKKLRE